MFPFGLVLLCITLGVRADDAPFLGFLKPLIGDDVSVGCGWGLLFGCFGFGFGPFFSLSFLNLTFRR
jgi:hypothetical protein